MNFLGPKYHISGNCFMHYLQSQIISFYHSHENNTRTVHASSNLLLSEPSLPGECRREAFSTDRSPETNGSIWLQHIQSDKMWEDPLFTAFNDCFTSTISTVYKWRWSLSSHIPNLILSVIRFHCWKRQSWCCPHWNRKSYSIREKLPFTLRQ